MPKIIPAPITMRTAGQRSAVNVRPQAHTPRTITTAEATDVGFLEQQPDEELIRIGVQMIRQRDETQAALDAITSVLDGRFDHLAVSESIIKEYGVADRKVANTWVVNEQHLDELRAKLGKEFSEWIEEGEKVSVVADRVQELRNMLGNDYHEFFKSEPVVKLKKVAINLLRMPNSPAARPRISPTYRKFFSVETKAKITIRPVSRGE